MIYGATRRPFLSRDIRHLTQMTRPICRLYDLHALHVYSFCALVKKNNILE